MENVDYWASDSLSAWNPGQSKWNDAYDRMFSSLCGGDFVAGHWNQGAAIDKYHAWKGKKTPEEAAKRFFEDIMSRKVNTFRLAAFQKEQALLDAVPRNAGFDLFYSPSGYWLVSENKFDDRPSKSAITAALSAGYKVTSRGYLLIDGKRVKKAR